MAARQRLPGAADAVVHPALLATLVYRFGMPGHATRDVDRVQANGQCFLVRRRVLERSGALAAARDSLCEDVTIARRIAETGVPVGFYEAGDLVETAMYAGWRETWRNWPRSLPMRDRYFGWQGAVGLAEVALVQALPAPLLALALLTGGPGWIVVLAGALAATRLGVLAGMRRAYARPPWTYWLSPLCDLPAAAAPGGQRGPPAPSLAGSYVRSPARRRVRIGGGHVVRVAYTLLIAHVAAVVFGLIGMLIALRYPELWSGTGVGEMLFSFGMRHGGALHILLGAASLFAFGLVVLGPRRTLVFFAAAVAVSLVAELIGTKTGWPFGAYEYARTLGPMVADRVPVAIPLSWFYLGLTSYLLGRLILARRRAARSCRGRRCRSACGCWSSGTWCSTRRWRTRRCP